MRHFCPVVVVALLISTFGCGSDSPSSPTPPARTFSFVGETSTPTNNAFWLARAAETVPGQIAIAVNANFPQQPFWKFRGDLLYTDTVLRLVNFTEGTFMNQGGAATSASITQSAGRVTMRIDRPDSVPGAIGSGTVLILRFVSNTSAGSASSPLQWNDAHAYTDTFSERLLATYNGTITVN